MKRIFALALALIVCVGSCFLLSACGKDEGEGSSSEQTPPPVFEPTFEEAAGGEGYILKKLKTDKTEIEIPATHNGKPVLGIADAAFKDNKRIKSVTLPVGLEWIGQSAFAGCTALTDIVIPEGVTEIGRFAFQGCTSLTGIRIPASLTTLGKNALNNCAALSGITVAEGNTVYRAQDNCLIEIATGTLLRGGKDSVIPADGSISKIGDYAFSGVKGLSELTVPDGVTSLGYSAFESCTALSALHLPASLESIGWYAFFDCPAFTDLYFGGTEAEWENVSVDTAGNSRLIDANVHYE